MSADLHSLDLVPGVYECVDVDGRVWAIKEFGPSPVSGDLCFDFDLDEDDEVADGQASAILARLNRSTFRRVVAPDFLS